MLTGDSTASDDSMTGLQAIKAQEQGPRAQIYPSPGLGAWLHAAGGSLVFSTYQTGRVFLLSGDGDGQLHAMERVVGTAMGLHIDRDKLWIANREQVWRFANVGPGHVDGVDHDAIFMPRVGWFIGNSDAHDLVADAAWQGQRYNLVFANTRFSCVATLDEHHSFRPLWAPPFITALGPGDRCHLNGICDQEGELAFATLCAETDSPLGWRNRARIGKGVVMDMRTNAVVCRGLTMPHSPRWHDGKLWLLDSGTATLGYVDFATQRLIPVATLPGFARGLVFVGGCAVIGLSMLRHIGSGVDFGLRELLEQRRVLQQCGLIIINLSTGRAVQWLRIEGGATELYDVAFAPGLRHAWTPGFREPMLHKVLMTVPDFSLPFLTQVELATPLPTTARLKSESERQADDAVQPELANPSGIDPRDLTR